MRRFLSLLLLVAALTGSAPARQNTESLPWWTSSVVADLGLSPQQQQHMRQIVRSYRDRLFDARNNAQKAQADLRDLMNNPTVSLGEARPAIERLAQARAESTRLVTQMSVELRSVLTIQQWRELTRRWGEVQRTRRNQDTEIGP